MKKSILMEKYPIYSLEIQKNETTYNSINEIIEYYKNLIDSHKFAKYIATFDNYEHTSALGGDINPDIKDAQILIFCFGPTISNTQILAVRPRSVGIAELENSYVIEFLEVPKEQLNLLMETWTKAIINK